jgi:hypothetical protein
MYITTQQRGSALWYNLCTHQPSVKQLPLYNNSLNISESKKFILSGATPHKKQPQSLSPKRVLLYRG